jgi:hypothetical protein
MQFVRFQGPQDPIPEAKPFLRHGNPFALGRGVSQLFLRSPIGRGTPPPERGCGRPSVASFFLRLDGDRRWGESGVMSATNSSGKDFLLGTLADSRVRVTAPIPVELSVEDGRLVAEVKEIQEFGFGDSAQDAVRDLQAALLELFMRLDQEAEVGPDLARVREFLRERMHCVVAYPAR